LHIAQPRGAKLKLIILISDKNGSAIFRSSLIANGFYQPTGEAFRVRDGLLKKGKPREGKFDLPEA